MGRTHHPTAKPVSASPYLILLHIEKTAGMTMRNIFCRNIRGKGCVEIKGICDENTHAEWEHLLGQMRTVPREQLEGWRAYHGHVRYGMHEVLPGPARYITFLRDPLKRVVSRYQMMRRFGAIPRHHHLDLCQPNWNLPTANNYSVSFDNWQTRVLAGLDRELPFGECGEEHFQAAKENLDRHFDFVGLAEQFDVSILLLNRLYRWPWRLFVPHNVAPPYATLPAPILKAIRKLNQYDYRLYAYARQRLANEVARAGLGLAMELSLFRACNALHRTWHRARHAFKRKRSADRPTGDGELAAITYISEADEQSGHTVHPAVREAMIFR